MGSIKDRNGRDWTQAEDIKKRWQEYTEELYKKELHNPDNHDGVITDLELTDCQLTSNLEVLQKEETEHACHRPTPESTVYTPEGNLISFF